MSKKLPLLGWVAAGEGVLKFFFKLIPKIRKLVNQPLGDPRVRFRRVEIRTDLLFLEMEML